MSYSRTANQYHNELTRAMQPLRGRCITPPKVREVLITKFPKLAKVQDWVRPSDHCCNHSNRGACGCANTKDALFERVKRGHYRVL